MAKKQRKAQGGPLDPGLLTSVAPIFRGETLAILASGPSMSQDVADQVRGGCRILAINDSYLLAPFADAHYFCDLKWHDWHAEGNHPAQQRFGPPAKMVAFYKDCRFLRFTLENSYAAHKEDGRVRVLGNSALSRPKRAGGLSTDPRYLRTGGNSGFQCLNLALHLGAARILLCGYDMQAKTDKDVHWFGQHPVRTNPNIFLRTFVKHFEEAAEVLKEKGVEVINCTDGSAIQCFRYRPLGECL